MCLGVPAKIIEIVDENLGSALAETDGVRRQVNVGLLALKGTGYDRLVGQWILVHVGFAMALIDEEEALQTLQLLRSADEQQ
ncbi:HypC/HybG/HupF family hydrogenase formation chaperone [Alteromonas facilis]|uniref:HypC/HybG/HupF family hydrogenase formation chaperone n=1 Tax=Alteromonas facilis TaxID=2048004 RepID=UPI000C282F7F|nr:HypC/HybG/HupF family hydrogenase formation chaperone [Alteromonas facilis]